MKGNLHGATINVIGRVGNCYFKRNRVSGLPYLKNNARHKINNYYYSYLKNNEGNRYFKRNRVSGLSYLKNDVRLNNNNGYLIKLGFGNLQNMFIDKLVIL